MTHRNDLLAMRARIEAQERDLDEAKSENELLRAAHAGKTRQAETLRRELDELRGEEEVEFAEASAPIHPRELLAARQRALARSMRMGALGITFAMMVGSLMLMTAPRHGPCSVAFSESNVAPLVRQGEVVATSGPHVVDMGEQCTVERIPAFGGRFDCRIEVRCGDQTLYGADHRSGYARCAGREVVSDRNVTGIDGDPAMTLDLARGVVTLEDRVGLATQRVRIQL